MYSKIRNTLTALIAASLFVATGWLFGHPVAATAPSQPSLVLPEISTSGSVDAQDDQATLQFAALHIRHVNRMNLAMPYFSFSLQVPQRRTD